MHLPKREPFIRSLYRLTKAGLIQYRLVPAKANGGEKKYYSLTGEGKKDMLEKMKNFWEKTTRIVWMDL